MIDSKNIYIEKLIIQKQKKNKVFEISLNRNLENYLVFKTQIGNVHFEYNESQLSVWIEDFENKDDIPIDFIKLEIKISTTNLFETFFANGYNNWTFSAEIPIREKFKNVSSLVRWLLYSFGEYTIIRDIGNFNRDFLRAFFYTYLRDQNQNILLIGSLNEKSFYTIFQYDPNQAKFIIIKDLKNSVLQSKLKIFHLFLYYSDYYTVFEIFSRLLDKVELDKDFISGYTTWYYHYNNISFNEIIKRIEFFGENQIPIDYFQIDDGYQKRVGDWLNLKSDFENRMGEIVSRVHKYKIKAGLWIAPFICEKKSKMFQYHENWLLKDKDGKPVVAGFNPLWSGKFYALNIYHPDFQEYLRNVFQTILEKWEFDLLKLDFLYAACLYPAKKKSRAQQMQDALHLIHNLTNWKKSRVKLLGCGIPFSHAFGNVDYTRVSSDVEEKWENYLSFFHFLERVSTYSAINSTLFRHPFNNKNFLNDPDVYFLRKNYKFLKPSDRDQKIKLTNDEKLTLFYVNQIFGGLVFISDPIEEFDDFLLQLYKKTFPNYKKKFINFIYKNKNIFEIHFSLFKNIIYKDTLKKAKNKQENLQLHYIFLLNVSDHSYKFQLDESEIYFVSYPYQEKYGIFIKNQKEIEIVGHHSLLLYKVPQYTFAYAGSDGHIFPGAEIKMITRKQQEFEIEYEDNAMMSSSIYFFILEKEIEKFKNQYPVQNVDGMNFIIYEKN